jgi:hypothetical protein
MEAKQFNHHQTAHCENGVTVSLLKHHGFDKITEPLAFGIGSGLFYIQIPFMKVNNGPAISFRTMPGAIFKRTCKALGIKVEKKKFNSPEKAALYLEEKVANNIPVGCQVGVFHLNYFPKEYRFHFNAHNLIVYGKNENSYLISDPVMETTTSLTAEELSKVRFAKGALAPKGHVYYPIHVGQISHETLKKAIIKGIKRNCRDMLNIPGSFAGVAGIQHTAKKIRKWRSQLGEKQAALYLGQIIRMQEEIGTGGGGFRFLYAAFLEEAAAILDEKELLEVSEQLTNAGDLWRDSAVLMAGIFKGRLKTQQDFERCADLLDQISAVEKAAFKQLSKIKFK